MGNKSKNKDYLVQGTILVAASFIARIIGMVYRIPLKNILGTEGIGYYSTANELYNIILMVSSFSIPLAVSRMVSERLHAGEQKNAYRVFKCAMRFAIAVGAAMSIVTFLFAGVITKYAMKAENASYALRVLAPAIFLFAITGVFRGFFQGREHHGSHGGLTGHRAGGKCHCLSGQLPLSLWVTERNLVRKKETTAWALLTALQAERLEP